MGNQFDIHAVERGLSHIDELPRKTPIAELLGSFRAISKGEQTNEPEGDSDASVAHSESDEQAAIERLAHLSPIEYDRVREKEPVTREITHAGVTGVGWKIERNHSESEADFEVRAIETAPRNEYGMARIILLSEHSYVLDE